MKKKNLWMVGIPIIALGSLAIGIALSNGAKEKYFDFEEEIVSPGEKLILSFRSVDLKIAAESDFYGCGHYSIIKKKLVQESGPITLDEKEVLVEKYSLFLRCEGPNAVIRQQ